MDADVMLYKKLVGRRRSPAGAAIGRTFGYGRTPEHVLELVGAVHRSVSLSVGAGEGVAG